MIPHRSYRPMAVPRTLEVRLEILKAIHELMGPAVRKFDPDQPRVPAGNRDGGQWTSGGGEASEVPSIIAAARRLDVAARPDAYQKCLDLCYPLLERFPGRWERPQYVGFPQVHE